MSAEHREQSRDVTASLKYGVVASIIDEKNRRVPVGFLHSGQLLRDRVQRLIPGDTLKVAFAAGSHSLQRILETVRVINPFAIGSSFGAGPQLGFVRSGVTFHPDGNPVLDVDFEHAFAAAIMASPCRYNGDIAHIVPFLRPFSNMFGDCRRYFFFS
jgi:hypothetical protein